MRILELKRGCHDAYPVPVHSVLGEDFPFRIQTKDQSRVQACFDALAERYGRKSGLSKRDFLMTPGAMALQFLAMNIVFGKLFFVDPEELGDPGFSQDRASTLSKQFIFDVQTHFVSPQFHSRYYLLPRLIGRRFNPELRGEKLSMERLRFVNYMREVFEGSDTKLALLTSAPHDDPDKWMLSNDELAMARDTVNTRAGRKKLYCHALVTPRHPGWMDELDRAISLLRPDAWKCYPVGAPFAHSKWPWRLDDEKLMYPAYEKMVKSGIRNVCVHKGLLIPFYPVLMRNNWKFNEVDDVIRAAKDWPSLNFIIYHSGFKTAYVTRKAQRETEKTGYIPWVSDLARMPARYGLNNVYAEIGSTFALTAVSAPRSCAAILGTLIKGMGSDHVLWGTDSIWYGSPQWQIEAFRRMEIPGDIREKFGFSQLGPPDGELKRMIFGANAARLYNLDEAAGFQEPKAA